MDGVVKSAVWHPDTGVRMVETIVNCEEHVGNRVAEGDIPKDIFWREIAGAWRSQVIADRREFARLRTIYEKEISELTAEIEGMRHG